MTSGEKAEKLILAHDGDMALLYIYFTRRNTTDLVKAARDLFMTKERVSSAYERLELQGFFDEDDTTENKPSKKEIVKETSSPSDEDPVDYTSAEITEYSKDKAFSALMQEAEKVIGRLPNKDDNSRLLDIYKHLALPPETIFYLLHYCAMISDRAPRMSFIQKTAYTWRTNGIVSFEQAEKFVNDDLMRRSQLGTIKKILNIRDRDLTSKEKEIFSSWIEKNYSEDDIHEAYEICIDRNNKYVCAYIDKILQNWQENGKDTAKSQPKKSPEKTIPSKEVSLPSSIRKK